MDSHRNPASQAAAPHRPTAALPWWERITVRLEVLTASVVVLAMLLLTALVTYQVSSSARQALVSASGDSAQRVSMLITERVQRIVNPADAIVGLLAQGLGIGLLPSSVPKYLRPDLCSVPIDGPQWSFSFLLISRRERSRASVRAMFELAEHL